MWKWQKILCPCRRIWSTYSAIGQRTYTDSGACEGQSLLHGKRRQKSINADVVSGENLKGPPGSYLYSQRSERSGSGAGPDG